MGNPPAHLTAAEEAAWAEIERFSAPGVPLHGDRLIVELAAIDVARNSARPASRRPTRASGGYGPYRTNSG